MKTAKAFVFLFVGEELSENQKAALVAQISNCTNAETITLTETSAEDLAKLVLKEQLKQGKAQEVLNNVNEEITHACTYFGHTFAGYLYSPTIDTQKLLIYMLQCINDQKLKTAIDIIWKHKNNIPVDLVKKYNLTKEVLSCIAALKQSNLV